MGLENYSKWFYHAHSSYDNANNYYRRVNKAL